MGLLKYCLPIKYHIHIWQESLQLSCSDSCQIWMWFKWSDSCFVKSWLSPTEKISKSPITLWWPPPKSFLTFSQWSHQLIFKSNPCWSENVFGGEKHFQNTSFIYHGWMNCQGHVCDKHITNKHINGMGISCQIQMHFHVYDKHDAWHGKDINCQIQRCMFHVYDKHETFFTINKMHFHVTINMLQTCISMAWA